MVEDPRVSDEATGLPPLEEVEEESSLIVLAWAGGSGVVISPVTTETQAVRWLHCRGLAVAEGGGPNIDWVQVHIAVPVEHAVDVAAALASGGMLDAD